MKRTISMILAVLMLLPIIASVAVAGPVISDKPVNVAPYAEVSVSAGLEWYKWYGDALIDEDREEGTYTPRGRDVGVKLTFEEEYYISELVVVVNGQGNAYDDEIAEVLFDTASVQIKGYDKKGALVYTSEVMDTRELKEAKFTPNKDVMELEILMTHTEDDGSSSSSTIWEVEAYATTPPVRCEAEQENIANQALLDSTVYSSKEEKNVTSSWWAMDLSRIVDGDIHTGTHTVKSSVFSLWFYFGQERLISEVVVHTNGNGALSPATGIHTKDIKDSQNIPLGEGVNYFNSYEVSVVLYDFNDEVVYESEVVDVSALTEYIAQAGVDATTVEVKISNAGAAGQGGGVFIWDVEIKEEKGEHVYEQVGQENPRCGFPGYKQFQCADPDCGMRMAEPIPATGYHVYDNGVVTNEATETANGVITYTCQICANEIKRDVPALEHKWVQDKVVEPTCEEGYTVYKCSDSGCTLTYRADFKDGLGHKYDDGVITERATIDNEGILTFTCVREDCGYKYNKTLRKAKYIDNDQKL